MIASPVSYKCSVTEISIIMNVSYLKENDKTFMHYPHALYATDVMFQKPIRSYSSMMKAKPYFRAKN